MDGTDETTEGEWVFTTSDGQPFLTDDLEMDTSMNCLKIITAYAMTNVTDCNSRGHYAIFCESEGTLNCFSLYEKKYLAGTLNTTGGVAGPQFIRAIFSLSPMGTLWVLKKVVGYVDIVKNKYIPIVVLS